MKIYSFPFALTLESSLTIAEIELLQKYDTRALALREVTPNGEEYETFRIGFASAEYGSVNASHITFVGETKNGLAGLSIMIPANLKGSDIGTYIDNKLGVISRNVAIIEANAQKAVVDVKAAKEAFLNAIIPLSASKVASEAYCTCDKPEKAGK